MNIIIHRTYTDLKHCLGNYHAGGHSRIHQIYLEGPEYPEYVMHIFNLKSSATRKYGNMLGTSRPVGPAKQTTEIA